ncbi:hypothetical protein GIB67_007280, partial [Kingdonia uniflora]
FIYDKHYYSVLEVNQTDYKSCNSQHPIKDITGGAGRDMFQLTEAKTYYCIRCGGYCYHSMGVPVFVKEIPSATITPTPAKNSPAPTNSGTRYVIPMFSVINGLLVSALPRRF